MLHEAKASPPQNLISSGIKDLNKSSSTALGRYKCSTELTLYFQSLVTLVISHLERNLHCLSLLWTSGLLAQLSYQLCSLRFPKILVMGCFSSLEKVLIFRLVMDSHCQKKKVYYFIPFLALIWLLSIVSDF